MSESSKDEVAWKSGIAVIGMACRFPGANNIWQFWDNLRSGVHSVKIFQGASAGNGSRGGQSAVTHHPTFAAVIENPDRFDANFFGYTSREAEIMDPQHRLFLECAWEAMEQAGYARFRRSGPVGVFAGSGFCSYLINHLLPNRAAFPEINEAQLAAGNERDALASTVSYKLNLRGPSLAVQTFCSTSLVAIHLACQSLNNWESDLALAGAVEITFPQEVGYHDQIDGVICSNGQTRAFDASAQGCVKGNGVGVVVLKRLEDALADGDNIHAVVKGSAVNNDGCAKVSYLAPGLDGQTSIIVEALANAEVSAETIGYLEAHGSATLLGDSIEIAAATKAFRTNTDKTSYCALGSCKTNIGNLERAAGIAGFIKAVLSISHGEFPPTLHFERPNPEVDFKNSPFYVPRELTQWESNGTPRRAGISSFGMGGTNAHLVIEEAPPPKSSSASRSCQLLLFSAKTPSAVKTIVQAFLHHLKANPDINIADAAFTLHAGREAFTHRCFVVANEVGDACDTLQLLASMETSAYSQRAADRPLVFLFPDSTEYYPRMASGLYIHEPFFRAQVEACAGILESEFGWDVRKTISLIENTDEIAANPWVCPAAVTFFVIQYALTQHLIHLGAKTAGFAGFGLGEYVAAALAGVLRLKDVLLILGRRCAASFSSVQETSSEQFADILEKTARYPPLTPFISSLTGDWITPNEATGIEYWIQRESVVNGSLKGARTISAKFPDVVLVEIGSGNMLELFINEMETKNDNRASRAGLSTHHADGVTTVSVIKPQDSQTSDQRQLAEALGKLWQVGVSFEADRHFEGEWRRRICLPTYPFERESFWIDNTSKLEGKLVKCD